MEVDLANTAHLRFPEAVMRLQLLYGQTDDGSVLVGVDNITLDADGLQAQDYLRYHVEDWVRTWDLQSNWMGEANWTALPAANWTSDTSRATLTPTPTDYMLDLRLTPPARGGELLSVSVPDSIFIGASRGLVPQTNLTGVLYDRTPPGFTATLWEPMLVPTLGPRWALASGLPSALG